MPDEVKVDSLYEEFMRTLSAIETTNNRRVITVFTEDLMDLHQQAKDLFADLGPVPKLKIITNRPVDEWLVLARSRNVPRKNLL
jgi:hypothetical protein